MTININLHPEMEKLGEHVGVGEIPLGNDFIILVHLEMNDLTSIEQWLNYSAEVREQWDDEQKPIYIMVDSSLHDIPMNNKTQQQLTRIGKIRPEIESHLALLVPKSIMASMMKTGLLWFNRSAKSSSAMVFHTREEGYEWLQEIYNKNQNMKG